MAFQGKARRGTQQFPSPEELYLSGTLPRTMTAVDSLWLHQGDVIRAYAQNHRSTEDLALELPTGTGKTLPGLLIGEWVRRKIEGPVLYATPTKQLARQVTATAQREGVPGVLLVGSARNWNAVDEAAVEGGEAIGITTYSAVFNSSPKLPEPRLLIFDDAHACNLSNYLAHSVRIIWPRQAPTTRTSRAASTASGVMASRLLIIMMRATWFMRRSTSRKLPPVMRTMATTDSASVGRWGS